MFLAAAATEAGAALTAVVTPVLVEPTSEKLTALKEQRKVKFTEAMTLEYGTKEQNDALTAVFKIDGEIRAEIAAIKQLEANAKIAELRNERISQLAERDNLLRALDAVTANKKSTPEDIAVATDNFNKANEPILNALLSKYATVKPAAVAADGTAKPAAAKGATSQTIEDKLMAYINGGQTPSDAVKSVIAEGFSRGTTGAVRTQMVKDGKIVG